MALFIPVALVVLGACFMGYSAWRDPENKASVFVLLLTIALIGGTLGCLGVGAWGYARTGAWDSFTVGGILALFAKAGADVRWLREPGLFPDLNRWYLEANLAWSFLVVPGALIGLWALLTQGAPAKPK